MRRTIEKSVSAGFTVALLITVLGSIFSVYSILRFAAAKAADEHTHQVLVALANLDTREHELEITTRDYLITGASEDLAAADAAIEPVHQAAAEVRQLTADNPHQQERLDKFDQILDAKLKARTHRIETRTREGFAAAQALVETDGGRQLRGQLLRLIAQMGDEEHMLLNLRSSASRASQRTTVLMVVAGGVLGLVLLAWAGWMVQRDMAARRRIEAALLESEQRFRFMADAIPVMVWTARTDGGVDYYNARWFEYTGFTFAQSRDWGWKPVLHPDDLEKCVQRWTSAVQSGLPYEEEFRFKRGADGVYHWFLIRGLPVRDDNGKVIKWVGTCTDVDAQKRAEEEVRQARTEADRANQLKSEFLANMSHEIRTPLTAVMGYADLLLEPQQSPSDRLNSINTIRRNSTHLLAVINDILDLSKIEAGEMKVERIPFCPCQVISDVASAMRVKATEKGLRFEVKIEGPIPRTIYSDPTRLRQILVNLVGNAVKFCEAGWVRLVVKMGEPTDSPEPLLAFEVVDSGIGMTREEISRLFQPFAQGDSSTTRRFGGTGLGLAISKRLAKSLGGDIAVDSSPGRGSLFALTVQTGPLDGVALLSNCSEAEAGSAQMSLAPAGPRLKGHVLLVEDGPDNQALLSHYLRKAGLEVSIADNGRIACDMIEEAAEGPGGYDVVLMDMQMPELDGYGATSKLRSRGFKKPIIALTAHAMAADREKCLRSGCTDYLSKPVTRQVMIDMVQRYLDGAPASPTADDQAAMGEFLSIFLARLPAKVRDMSALLEKQQLADLGRLAHELKGTGGLYGFPQITEAAGRLEETISTQKALDAITGSVRELTAVVQAVQSAHLRSQDAPQPETKGQGPS